MSIKLWIFNTVFCTVLGSFSANAQTIPFETDRWEFNAQESKIIDYMGRQSLFLKGGLALIKDSDFTNGTIEYDLNVTGARGFMGAVWRVQDESNYEEFYMRPHQRGNPDATQYTPVFNGLSGWQLYYGDGYGAPVKYPFDVWVHVKIVIANTKAEVYIVDMDKPALYIPELKRDMKSGKVGLEAGNFAPAYFSNFSFAPEQNPTLLSSSKSTQPLPEGTVKTWSLSNLFNFNQLEGKEKLSSQEKNGLEWVDYQVESSGTLNLAQRGILQDGKNVIFAKVEVISDREQTAKFSFGYSDVAKVYCNDQLVYSGNRIYMTRDYRYLGTIGQFDDLFLQLKEGENEIWVAVAESFGGWGITARFEPKEGIEIK